jgi:hypothetical protein
MWLLRVTPDPFANSKIDDSKSMGQRADECEMMTSGYMGELSPHTRTHFKRFGNGARRSDFEVISHWEDVEQLIELFCNAGHPQAIKITEALKLAAAARESGWEPKISN